MRRSRRRSSRWACRPGTSISENRICRQIGVSRTPVRAAIIRLVEDGLIEVFPQKGSFVAPIKLSAVRSNHFIRKALELAVLRRAGASWSPDRAAKARQILSRQERALEEGDLESFHELDEDFHRSFCTAAGLEGVWSTIEIAKARVDRVHRLAAGQGRLPLVVVEHRAIVDALDAGDPNARPKSRLSPRTRARHYGKPYRQPSRDILSTEAIGEWEDEMATIERVEILMVDLKPKVKRTDAIQSFVSQETPIVRIADRDGAAARLQLHNRHRRPVGDELIARTLAPALIGRDAAEVEQIWRDLNFLTHATTVGAITASRSPRSTLRYGTYAAARPGCRCMSWPAARRIASRSTRPKAAGCIWSRRRWSTTPCAPRTPASAAPRSRSAARMSPRMSRGWPPCARRSGRRWRS